MNVTHIIRDMNINVVVVY